MRNALWILALAVMASLGLGWILADAQRAKQVNEARRMERSADSLRAVASGLQAEARMWQDRATSRAVGLAKKDTVYRLRVDSILALPEPETLEDCEETLEESFGLIRDLSSQAEGWRMAFNDERAATGKLIAANRLLEQGADSLRGAIRRLEPKPRTILGRLLNPELRPGVFAGFCTDGRPCAGVGVTISF